jgi:hypothetical protein
MTNARRAAAAVAVLAALCAVGAPAAAQPTVPFTDPHAHGSLALCDKTGHAVTSGSMTVAPVAWFAVSSTAAPEGYANGKATLYAYQPIKGVDPGNWSGEALTGSSTFTNPRYPMSQGTVLDRALGDFTGAFPPQAELGGLVELRLTFNGPKGLYNSVYPAAVLKVTRTTWTLVQGGGAPCNAGTAKSSELLALPASAFATPPRATPAADAHKASTSTPAGEPSTAPTATAGGTAPAAAPSTSSAAVSTHASGSDAGLIAGIAGALVAVLGGGGAYWYLRRRSIGT